MSGYFRLDEQRLQSLESELAGAMPISMLERGWDYYRREKVLNVQVVDGTSIYGAVRGTDIYAVTLDSDDFGYSTCTCPYKGNCKHMAAVFYAYCDYAGLSPDEIHNRLLYGVELFPVETAGPIAASGGRTAAPAAESGSAGEHDPHRWLGGMEDAHGEVWRQCRHSLHPLQTVLSSLKGTSKNWAEGMRRLHWMHAILFVVELAERAYSATDSYSRYYYEMAFARMTEPWINQYHELAGELRPSQMTEPERQALRSLLELFHGRDMDREHQLHRWETFYFSLWSKLAGDPAWRADEAAWLAGKLESLGSAKPQAAFYPMALAFLAFAEDRDEEAIRLLAATPFNRTALLACDCAVQRIEDGDWSKLERWMAYLFAGLSAERKSRAFGPFLTMCRVADVQQPDNPLWQRYLVSFLPYSYSALTEHWLERGSYMEWADLQLLLGIEPEEIDVQVLREISKAEPAALMPLYHQSIDLAIRSRNRQGYKRAVKLMKKLERLYKAEKLGDKWSRYVDGIVRKHQRLRALQEELWRGKIVT